MALIKNSTPRYMQIAEKLYARIRSGQIVKQLPTRDALASEFDVNPKTVDKAMVVLEDRHAIERKRGLGIFVHPAMEGSTVNEFYFVFPGHTSMLEASNPWHRLVTNDLSQILTISRDLRLEPRLISICPDNDMSHLDMELVNHLNKGDIAMFIGSEYRQVIRSLANRNVKCLIVHSGGDGEMAHFPDMPVRMFDIDYDQLFENIFHMTHERGCKHLGAVGTRSSTYTNSVSLLTLLRDYAKRENTGHAKVRFDSTTDIAQIGSLEQIPDHVDRLLAAQPSIDALLTFNHFETRAVQKALDQRKHTNRPRVLCYDSMHHYETVPPEIDVFKQPIDLFFARALRIISGEIPFSRDVELFAPEHIAAKK